MVSYSTLGEDAVAYVVDHSEMTVALASMQVSTSDFALSLGKPTFTTKSCRENALRERPFSASEQMHSILPDSNARSI